MLTRFLEKICVIGIFACLTVLLFALVPALASAMSSSNYRLDAYEINSVGGVGSSTNYKLVSSGGSPLVNEGSSTYYKLGSGFAYEISYGMRVGFYPTIDVNLGHLLSGTPVTGYTDIKVTTDAPEAPRYNVAVARNDATTTMDLTTNSTIDIADKTAWDPTANSGNGNATTWSGTGLGFTVYASTATKDTTWWGSGTSQTDTNNKYAGFPSTAQTIMSQAGYTTGETTTSVGYKLDVPAGQSSGYYDGIIVYSVTMAL